MGPGVNPGLYIKTLIDSGSGVLNMLDPREDMKNLDEI